jgi:hypothetical protein
VALTTDDSHRGLGCSGVMPPPFAGLTSVAATRSERG